MSKNVSFNLGESDEITVYASVSDFCKGNNIMHYSGPTPDDLPEVEDLNVKVEVLGEILDITDILNEALRNKIEDECIEQAGDSK